mmetsp:Transcript_45614/g.132775  ORF Transcript_45614/g.132775 Transcript_45614/m.132775 type:complete len:227 (-) Transcript_45614:3038-3718(-)
MCGDEEGNLCHCRLSQLTRRRRPVVRVQCRHRYADPLRPNALCEVPDVTTPHGHEEWPTPSSCGKAVLQSRLQKVQALCHADMVRLRSLGVAGKFDMRLFRCRELLGGDAVGNFQGLQFARMVIGAVADELLQEGDAFPHGGMVSKGRAGVLGALVQCVRVLGMCRLECRELLRMLVSRVAHQLFQIFDALGEARVVCLQRLEFLDILSLLAMRRRHLRMGLLELL